MVKKAWPHSTWFWVWSLSHESVAQIYVLCYGNIVRSTTVKNTSSVIATHTYFLPFSHALDTLLANDGINPSNIPVIARAWVISQAHLSFRLESETFHPRQTLVATHWRWKSLFSMAKCNAWLNGNAILTRLNGAKSLLPATRNSCLGLFLSFFFFLSKI